jgi:hypothetical protein
MTPKTKNRPRQGAAKPKYTSNILLDARADGKGFFAPSLRRAQS